MKKSFNILLVDDDDVNNFLSKELLKMHLPDVVINSALDGQLALDHLFNNKNTNGSLPDIILLDINMPVMDGWDFLDKLEETNVDDFRKINIFMYTSSVYFEDINRAKSHKLVKNIFTKPINQQMIREMIASLN